MLRALGSSKWISCAQVASYDFSQTVTYGFLFVILRQLFLLELLRFGSCVQVLVVFESSVDFFVFFLQSLRLKLLLGQLGLRLRLRLRIIARYLLGFSVFIDELLVCWRLRVSVVSGFGRIAGIFCGFLKLLALRLDFFIGPNVINTHDLMVGCFSVLVRHMHRARRFGSCRVLLMGQDHGLLVAVATHLLFHVQVLQLSSPIDEASPRIGDCEERAEQRNADLAQSRSHLIKFKYF